MSLSPEERDLLNAAMVPGGMTPWEAIWIAARNYAYERAAKVCATADKSTHPADLADAIRRLAQLKE